MDPTMNPTPTPNPAAVPGVAPAPGSAPVPPAPVSPAPVPPVSAPVPPISAPVEPAQVEQPVEAPAEPAVPPVDPVPPVAPAPINPVINPGAPQPVTPVNPVFTPTGGGMVAATDPITMPAPPKAPDPVEEELKAPFKAAGPVPGSIGSAISMPASENTNADQAEANMADAFAEPTQKTPSVSFTDPATAQAPAARPIKKKTSKNTLIALSIVAGLVVIALTVVLLMQLGIISF